LPDVYTNPTGNTSAVHPGRARSRKAEALDRPNGDVAVEEFLALLAVQIVVLLAETVVRYLVPGVRTHPA